MHNKETIIGIALFVLGNGIGWGLQMLGVVNLLGGAIVIALSSLVGIGLLVYGIKIKDNKLASQIYDADMGKHLDRIKKMLNNWKKQLIAMSEGKGLWGDLRTAVEKERGFYQVLEHCPSIQKGGQDLRLNRVIYEARLKSNSATAEDDTHIKGKMRALAEAIDDCLSDNEYSKHSCSGCPKNRGKN